MYIWKVYTLSFNAGGCAAMYCLSCKVHWCFWCRSVIVADGTKHKDDGRATHDHVFDCQKAPHDKTKILTDSVLFPVGHHVYHDQSDFLHAFLKIQRLEILALQIQKGLCICISGVYTSCSSPCVFQAGPQNKSKSSCYIKIFKSCLSLCETRETSTEMHFPTNERC